MPTVDQDKEKDNEVLVDLPKWWVPICRNQRRQGSTSTSCFQVYYTLQQASLVVTIDILAPVSTHTQYGCSINKSHDSRSTASSQYTYSSDQIYITIYFYYSYYYCGVQP